MHWLNDKIIVEWIDYINNPLVAALYMRSAYDQTKCESRVGQVTSGVLWRWMPHTGTHWWVGEGGTWLICEACPLQTRRWWRWWWFPPSASPSAPGWWTTTRGADLRLYRTNTGPGAWEGGAVNNHWRWQSKILLSIYFLLISYFQVRLCRLHLQTNAVLTP